MHIPAQPGDRELLIQLVDQELDAAPDVEQGMYGDKSIEDPEQFLVVITDHTQRTEALKALKERLQDAT